MNEVRRAWVSALVPAHLAPVLCLSTAVLCTIGITFTTTLPPEHTHVHKVIKLDTLSRASTLACSN